MKHDGFSKDSEAADALGFAKIAGLQQVHGNRTIIIRDQLDRTEKADGLHRNDFIKAVILKYLEYRCPYRFNKKRVLSPFLFSSIRPIQ